MPDNPALLQQAIAEARDQHGRSLLDHSRDRHTLVVFLRHAGCPFCAETLSDLATQRTDLEASGVNILLVCQWPQGQAMHLFENAGLTELPRIHDPERSLYAAFGLKRGNLWQIGGPFVWFRVLQAALAGHRVGKALGDAFQMPGAFLIRDGKILKRYRHRSQASRPDYKALATTT